MRRTAAQRCKLFRWHHALERDRKIRLLEEERARRLEGIASHATKVLESGNKTEGGATVQRLPEEQLRLEMAALHGMILREAGAPAPDIPEVRAGQSWADVLGQENVPKVTSTPVDMASGFELPEQSQDASVAASSETAVAPDMLGGASATATSSSVSEGSLADPSLFNPSAGLTSSTSNEIIGRALAEEIEARSSEPIRGMGDDVVMKSITDIPKESWQGLLVAQEKLPPRPKGWKAPMVGRDAPPDDLTARPRWDPEPLEKPDEIAVDDSEKTYLHWRQNVSDPFPPVQVFGTTANRQAIAGTPSEVSPYGDGVISLAMVWSVFFAGIFVFGNTVGWADPRLVHDVLTAEQRIRDKQKAEAIAAGTYVEPPRAPALDGVFFRMFWNSSSGDAKPQAA